MKRKAIIFILSATAILFSLQTSAQNKPVIKSVDLTLPLPKVGQSLFDARETQLSSAVTEYGDLAPSGEISIMEVDWIGDFNENNDGDMFFRQGFIYKMRLKFVINPYGKYTTDYVFTGSEYHIDGSRIKVSVNGIETKILQSTPYVINVETSFKIGESGSGTEREIAQSQPSEYDRNKDTDRASLKAYSIPEADADCPDTNPFDLIVITDYHKPHFYADAVIYPEYMGQACMRVTKVLVDTSDGYAAGELNNTIMGPYNIREVWLSDKVDALQFLLGICNAMQVGYKDATKIYSTGFSMLFHSKRATLFIPESAADAIKQRITRPTWSIPILFTIKTYKGDVYQAQKAGAEAAQPLCINHIFTAKVAAADKIYKYGDCKVGDRYYYSCKICGKCEYNDKHIFSTVNDADVTAHSYDLPLANDQAYIGVNAAGHHVWRYSCIWCQHSEGYHERNTTKTEWKQSGTEASYEYYKKMMAQMAQNYEEECLLMTTPQPGMFVLSHKSNAKMSSDFQSVVNYALNDNLLDDNILGMDYTRPITHLQLRSLAVCLAEEMLGYPIKFNKKTRSSFTNDWSAKAHAMGLLDGPYSGSNAPVDTDIATRQDVALTIYRTLRYLEKQQLYSYSEFDNGLAKYTDYKKLAPWAEDAVAFMEALGLMKGTSPTELSPESVCTIEQAIEVTEKSTHAQQLGWYQARSWGENMGRSYMGSLCSFPHAGASTNHFISPGERVWVTAPRLGVSGKFYSVIDSYSGQTLYIDAEWFRPIRPKVFTSKRATIRGILFKQF